MKQEIKDKIYTKRALIGVVGLGYVGLPLLLRYVEEGFSVIGFDIDPSKIESLRSGESYFEHIESSRIVSALRHSFQVTTDFSKVSEVDAIIICVPTPLSIHREPDLSFVINTTEMIAPYLRRGHIVSLESTTYPGTTEEELLPRIESAGFTVGEDVFLLYSPEREDPGNPNFETRTIPKVVGGHTENCLDVSKVLYGEVIDEIIPVSSTKVAEMTKLLENIHRAINIGLVNEMKIVADRMGIDIHEVIRAASSKPFGFTPFYPGPGLGGHCIPIDPFYLTWKAKEYDINTRFIELAGEVNAKMPRWVVSKCMDALNDRGKSLNGSSVLVLGISYKKNIGDMRESPAVEIMELLKEKGALVSYSDPYVPIFPPMRKHSFELSSARVFPDSIKGYDFVVVATNHDDFDYNMIQKNAQLIVDTRGVYLADADNVVKA